MIFALPHTMSEERGQGTWSLFDKPQMEMGECYNAKRDNLFASYVRFGEDVTEGDGLKSKLPLLDIAAGAANGNIAAGTKVINFAAASTLSTMISAGLFTNDTDLKEMRGHALLWARDSAGPTARLGIVTDFTDTRLDVIWKTADGTLDVALADATTSFQLSAPWIVEKAHGTDTIVGFAQVDAKAKEYGLILYKGYGSVKGTEAVTAGDTLSPAGTDATEEGEVEGGEGASITEPIIGTALTKSGADGELFWADAQARPISKIPFFADPFLRGTKRPGEA